MNKLLLQFVQSIISSLRNLSLYTCLFLNFISLLLAMFIMLN